MTPDEGARLDPADWDEFRTRMHDLLDTCVDRLQSARDHPWQPVPEGFEAAVAISDGPKNVWATLTDTILPSATGNTHPAFFGWVHGTGQAMGLASELVAATMNANCGGREHGAIHVEREVLRWLCAAAGMAPTAGGILTTGTSQATLYALTIARHAAFGDVGRTGIGALPPLRVYAADGAHSCAMKSLQIMGHGAQALVTIPAPQGRMDVAKLEAAIAADRAAGLHPLAIIGTAGSVNMGTFDDLTALADIGASQGLWLHVDGAFGFWTRLADDPWRSLSEGMGRADSIALDGHKWLGVPYECGACLVADQAAHLACFTERADYLTSAEAGLAAGDWWPTDYGLELSRGFRALKMWTTLQTHDAATIGAAVTDNCKQAALMGELAEASDVLELAAPVVSNLCVMRPLRGDATRIAADLQIAGEAVFSTTMIDGQTCLRAAIVNHRTTQDTVRTVMRVLEDTVRRA